MTMRRTFCTLARGIAVGLALTACGDDAVTPAERPREVAAEPPSVAAPVARVETADAWLDLLAQRPSAVLLDRGRIIVDLDQENARKHVALAHRHHWRLGVMVPGTAGGAIEDRRAGVIVGRTAALDVPLDGDLAPKLHTATETSSGLAVAITVRGLVDRQSVTVLWNEQPVAHLPLGMGWERRTVSLPPAVVRPGDNRLRLHFRHVGPWGELPEVSGAVARVEIGSEGAIASIEGVEPPSAVYRTRPGSAPGRPVVELGSGSALAYYVVPPRRAKLILDVRGQGAVDVRVSSSEDHAAGRRPTVLLDEPLRPTGRRAELDLTAWGGIPVRIEVRVRGEGATATISAAKIVAKRSVPVDRRERKPRDIVILTIEGARADAFALGARTGLPTFEALSAEALVFDRAYSLSPQAVPSHAAWLSSVVPPVHLTVRGTFVADGQVLFPETLSPSQFFRALVTANNYVNAERGLLQGFDRAIVVGSEAGQDNNAPAVITAAIETMKSRKERWLLYANVSDPQAPYEPPREMVPDLQPFVGAPIPRQTHIWVGRVKTKKTVPSEQELEYVRELYRGELRLVDRELGRLLDALEAAGRLDEAIVVVVGIHGEEFFEHGGAGHDRTLFEESLRVPLAIRAPASLAPGRVETGVDLLDLAPTLADLIGVPAPHGWQGESLVPIIDDPEPPPRLLVAYLGDGSRAGIVGDFKLIAGPGRAEAFYDLREDPGELRDRLADGGVALRIVRTALAWQIGHESVWRRARWGTAANLRPAFALDLGM